MSVPQIFSPCFAAKTGQGKWLIDKDLRIEKYALGQKCVGQLVGHY
jgi:hypothetical protein